MPVLWQIAAGLGLMIATTAFHGAAILSMLGLARARLRSLRPARALRMQIAVLSVTVCALAALNIAEAMAWAFGFLQAGAVANYADSFYFTLVTLTTLGYGDIVPDAPFRLMAGLCALTGLMLTGMTAATLIELLRHFAIQGADRAGE